MAAIFWKPFPKTYRSYKIVFDEMHLSHLIKYPEKLDKVGSFWNFSKKDRINFFQQSYKIQKLLNNHLSVSESRNKCVYYEKMVKKKSIEMCANYAKHLTVNHFVLQIKINSVPVQTSLNSSNTSSLDRNMHSALTLPHIQVAHCSTLVAHCCTVLVHHLSLF